MTSVIRIALVLTALSCWSGSCGGAPSPGAYPSPPSREAPSGDEPPPNASTAEATPPPPEIGVLALAQYAHFAAPSWQGGEGCDLGTPSQHGCTLGGFRTGWGAVGREEGTTFANVVARQFKIHLYAPGPQAATLQVRVRPARARSLLLRLGRGQPLRQPITPGEWNVVSFAIDAGRLRQGTNELALTLRGGRREEPLAQIDWVRLAPPLGPPPHSSPAGPSPSESPPSPLWPQGSTSNAQLILPAGAGVSYILAVPEQSRLALVASTSAPAAQLTVTIQEEGQPEPRQLHQSRLSARARQPVSLSLEEFAGKLVRLHLGAADGPLALIEPEIKQRQRPNPSEDSSEEVDGGGAPSPRQATNLIIVLIDTLRPDHLVSYNSQTRVQSAFFEQFAQRGTLFLSAQAQENWTKPSVATLLSSLYPCSHNAKTGEAVLPDGVDLLGEILKNQGFVTAAFIANGYVSDRFGFGQGWDTYRNYVRERRRNRAENVVNDTIAWLRGRPEGQPFFLYVHTIDPHVPYSPPRRYRELYDPEPYHGPIVAGRTAQLLGDIKVGRLSTNERDRFRLEALYDGEISYHDEHFGRLLAALQELGLYDNTVIWVTSDHGEEFFEHGSVGHGHNLYQELLHVPLALSYPGVERGQRLAPSVGLIDVLPTSLALMGLEPHDEAQGHNLVPLLRGQSQPHLYDAVFSEFLDNGRAVKWKDLKLIVQGRSTSLFDLALDPREQNDIADQRPLATRLLTILLAAYEGSVERPNARGRQRPRRVHRRQETEIDQETLEQLRALGYMQ